MASAKDMKNEKKQGLRAQFEDQQEKKPIRTEADLQADLIRKLDKLNKIIDAAMAKKQEKK